MSPTQDHQALTQLVQDSLHKAQEQTAGLRRTNTRLVTASIVCSAATSVVAGGTAATIGMNEQGIRGDRQGL